MKRGKTKQAKKSKGAATAPVKAALKTSCFTGKAKTKALLAQATQLMLPGLEEVPAHPGSAHTILRVKGGKIPTTEQRVAIAKRIQDRKDVGHYVPQAARQAVTPPQTPPPQSEEPTMRKTSGIPGVKPEEIVKAHAVNAKEFAAAEAARLKEEARKAKAAAEAEKKAAKARKAIKKDVTPKVEPKPEPKFAGPKSKTTGQKGAPLAAAPAPAPKGRPRKGYPENTKFHVVNDPTKTGMSKTMMTTAAKMKKFTKAELVAATKKELTEDRAGKFFDYFVSKGAIAPVKS